MVKFLLGTIANIFTTAVVNLIFSALLLLVIAPDRFGLVQKLENLSLKIFKKRIDIQIICYLITLPFTIYFLSRPLEN
tara:strand:- start:163 stop:396 length:234 start_codon:yes stop_codon:yes gene_type:complete